MAVIRQGNAEGGNGRPFDLRQQKSLRLQAPSAASGGAVREPQSESFRAACRPP